MENSRFELNKNLAQMLKGGVIMDVTTPRAGKDCRGGGSLCGYGFGENTGGHSRGGRSFPYERPQND